VQLRFVLWLLCLLSIVYIMFEADTVGTVSR